MVGMTSIVSTSYDGSARRLWLKSCMVCSKDFYLPKHRLLGSRSCSRVCAAKARADRNRQAGHTVEVVCTQCSRSFSRKAAHAKRVGTTFCNQTCRGQHRKTQQPTKLCLQCGVAGNSKYCPKSSCRSQFQFEAYIARWKLGLETGNEGALTAGAISPYVRRYCLELAGNQCSECGWAKVNSVTGKIPLTIDHINGDSADSRQSNLRVLCPSCHSLTPTYGSLNRGKGRVRR